MKLDLVDCAERRAHATTPTHKQQRAESRREGASEAQREVEAAFKSRRLEPSPMGSQTQSLHKLHGSCDTNGAHRGVGPESTGGGRQHAPHTPNPKDAQQPGGGKRARRQHRAGEAGRTADCNAAGGRWIGNWRITTDTSATGDDGRGIGDPISEGRHRWVDHQMSA
jgi:hypothetical protein